MNLTDSFFNVYHACISSCHFGFPISFASVQYCINGGLTERREEQVGLLFNLEIARLHIVSIISRLRLSQRCSYHSVLKVLLGSYVTVMLGQVVSENNLV